MGGRVDMNLRWIYNSIRIHPVTFIFIIGVIILAFYGHYNWQSAILIFIIKQPTAFATLSLALVTVIAILREPASRVFNRPILNVLPEKEAEYPRDRDKEISTFAVEPGSGNNPTHIWVRLFLMNLGRTVAQNVYIKVVSVKKLNVDSEVGGSTRLTPFNPFKSRWVSLDKTTTYKAPWHNSILKGTSTRETVNGNLAPNEAEYLNMCTFVGKYRQEGEILKLCPLLVPGLPEDDGHHNTVGQGSVAGMNKEILEIKRESNNGAPSTRWENASFEYELIVGGTNFKTKHLNYIVKCSIDNSIKDSTKEGNYNEFQDLANQVKIRISIK